MVIANLSLAELISYPRGVKNSHPFEMWVANLKNATRIMDIVLITR